MKKIILIIAFAVIAASCFAGQVNIIMKDGSLKTGELIGSDEEAYYIKTADNKAETVLRSKIKKVFDAAGGGSVTGGISSGITTPAGGGITKKADEIKVESVPYKVLESGMDVTEPDYFGKSTDNYLMMEVDVIKIDMVFLDTVFKNSFGLKDDSLLISYTIGMGAYYWPTDGLAIGVNLGIDIPMPLFPLASLSDDDVGGLFFAKINMVLRWIPYSDKETAFYIDLRGGARKTIFDSTINGQAVGIDSLEARIAIGIMPALQIGWVFCPAQYTIGTSTVKTPVDLGGPYISASVLIF